MRLLFAILLVVLLTNARAASEPPKAPPPRLMIVHMAGPAWFVFSVEVDVVKKIPYTVAINVTVDGKLKKAYETRWKDVAMKVRQNRLVEVKGYRVLRTNGEPVNSEEIPKLLKEDTLVLQCEKFHPY